MCSTLCSRPLARRVLAASASRTTALPASSPYIQWVVTVFMILFGVNFNAYFLLLLRRFRRAASSEEVRAYLAIILAAVAVITVNIRSLYGTFGEALRHAAFQVGSIITTTAFPAVISTSGPRWQRGAGAADVRGCLRGQHWRRHQSQPLPSCWARRWARS